MNIAWIFVCILVLLDFGESVPKDDLVCLTGHKILVRQHFTNRQTNQTKYKLMYKCLCPNNYYGQECENHLPVDCYLNPLNHQSQITAQNIKQEMELKLEFSADCYVSDKQNLSKSKIQLRQFLNRYNQSNAFGVRKQFGPSFEIVWANDTQLFEQFTSQLKTTYQNLSQPQKQKLLIGNHQNLYNTPFTYSEQFLGYGLINGKIFFSVNLINPQASAIKLAEYSLNQAEVTGLQEYIKSYVNINIDNSNEQRDNLIRNITEMIRNGKLNQTVEKYINGSQKAIDLPFDQTVINSRQKPLPQIMVSIKINPYNSSFYQVIRLQTSIKQTYQQIVTHESSLNSAQWIIPVKVQGLGLPQPLQKHLTVTDASSKSYYRIILVVAVAGLIYFGLTYGYKRYKKWKNRQYSEFDYKNERSGSKRVQESSSIN